MTDSTDKQRIAKLFYDQCLGGYSGHMASIPHNPQINSIVSAFCETRNKKGFIKFLRECADALETLETDEDLIPF